MISDAAVAYEDDKSEINNLKLQLALVKAQTAFAQESMSKVERVKENELRDLSPGQRAQRALLDKILGTAEELELEKIKIDRLKRQVAVLELGANSQLWSLRTMSSSCNWTKTSSKR